MTVLRKLVALLGVGLSGSVSPVLGSVLDSNFRETSFAVVGSQVTGLAWAPDGSDRLFVTHQGGEIRIVKNGSLLAMPFATVNPLYTANECGLIGICFDPNFMGNGWVYVFATVSSWQQQIIRYTAVGDMGTNKTVLVPGLPTVGANHNGGAVGVGPDGKLYWAIGDFGSGTGVDGDLGLLAAKVGRANLDGSVPADNPFADGTGPNNDYIWARGFRNPFTFTFQPNTGFLWVNCVGNAYEQVFLVGAGDHAGWDNYENNQPAGFIKPKIKYRTNGTDTRNVVAGSGAVRTNHVATFTTTSEHGFRQGEKLTIASVADASFNGSYFVAAVPGATTFTIAQPGADATSGAGTATTLNQGGSITGGCFHESTGVPPAYRGNYFYGDFNSGRVMRATLNSSNEVTSVDYFSANPGTQIDMAIGPDGALYYASYAGIIYRAAYTNFARQEIIVTPSVVGMFEGGEAALTVRLARAPAADVEVTLARSSGDTDIAIAGGATLTFTPTNWSAPQIVKLHAALDGDLAADTAIFRVSSDSFEAQNVTVHATDMTTPPVLGPVTVDSGAIHIVLSGQAGSTYVFEATTSFSMPWTSIRTNTLTGTSTNTVYSETADLPWRFFRARVAP